MPFKDYGGGYPVVLLHAFPLSAQMWDRNAAAIAAAGYRVICPEFPGFGENRNFGPVSTMDSMAESVIELLEHLGIREAAFAGLSMGGYVLFRILRTNQRLVSCFALCDTTSRADTEEKRLGRFELITQIEREGSKVLAEVMLPNLLSSGLVTRRPLLVEDLRRRFLQCDPEAACSALRGMAERPDSSDVLGIVKMPLILIFGAEDKVTDLECAQEMADTAVDARLVVLPDAGHYSNLEDPEGFNKNLISFLDLHLATH